MKRLVSVVVVALVTLSYVVTPASAEKPQPLNLYWSVDWGQPGTGSWSGNSWTTWFAKSDPAMDLQTTNFMRWATSDGIRHVTPEGVQAMYAAFYHAYDATGFFIGVPGVDHGMAGTFWNRENCFPGPSVAFDFANTQLVVHNTTPISLWIYNPQEFEVGRELKAGETLSRRMFGHQNELWFQTTPSSENWNTCMKANWWLDR